jgi:tripartite-type tricarboxylate transporter receptor subunit TctC
MGMQRVVSALFGLFMVLLSSAVFAEDPQWPASNRSIHVIVPAQAGSGVGNTIVRAITDALSEKLGNRFVLQNLTTSNSYPAILGSNEASLDGYTLLFATLDTLVLEPALQRSPSFDFMAHFVPVGLVAEIPHVLLVNNTLPTTTLDEFTEYIERYPGMVHFGSSGNGSAQHLAGESYMSATGTNMVHVPYSAAEAATNNLVSGDIQAMFQVVSGALNYVRTDRVRPLVVMSSRRSPALPDVPTIAEAGHPSLQAVKWYALLAPRGTPRPIIERYNEALNAVLESPAMKERLLEVGATPLGGAPETLGEYVGEEQAKWSQVIKDAHLQLR